MRPKRRQALRDKLRETTARTCSGRLETIIGELNRVRKGGLLPTGPSLDFPRRGWFLRRGLRAILRQREQRPGDARRSRDHRRWPNAFFAAHGRFTLHEGFVLASQSRCGHYRLESRVRENRLHSSAGAEDASPSRPLSSYAQRTDSHLQPAHG